MAAVAMLFATEIGSRRGRMKTCGAKSNVEVAPDIAAIATHGSGNGEDDGRSSEPSGE
jgi:hypothetical protein